MEASVDDRLPSLTDFSFADFLKNEHRFGLDPNRPHCKAFREGLCPQGNKCPDKHIAPQPYGSYGNVVCKHWLRGLCKKGDTCEYSHEYNLKDKDGRCRNVTITRAPYIAPSATNVSTSTSTQPRKLIPVHITRKDSVRLAPAAAKDMFGENFANSISRGFVLMGDHARKEFMLAGPRIFRSRR
ncbi:RNA-binding component of cleavage and polyadenylation factor [Peltigera leucophlebia]|nr:RNA-binding component of cleavage and polyadenylation factor [Peltigera leucophlebia]